MLHSLCPVCKTPLEKQGKSAVCKNGHSYDFAKEGYLYLLSPSSRHSKDPGDNKDMVKARKCFLDGEYYAPLANAVSDIINGLYSTSPITVIDAGVGTGYYLQKIISSRTRACANNIKDIYLGADLSKYAVRYAAKANLSAECAVASVFDMPYADGIADIVLCVFSPFAEKEYARLLKQDGTLIVASPCENHLIELRRALYDDVRAVETPLKTSQFEIANERELSFSFNIDNDDISSLLAMTPYAYRAPKDRISLISAEAVPSLTADFKISTLKKTQH